MIKFFNVHESLSELGRQLNNLRRNNRSGKVATQVLLLRDLFGKSKLERPRHIDRIITCASCQCCYLEEIKISISNEFCQIETQLIQVASPSHADSGQKGEKKFKAHSFFKEVNVGHVKHLRLPFMWTPCSFHHLTWKLLLVTFILRFLEKSYVV